MGLIAAAIGLASGILQYINNKQALKYIDDLKKAQDDLQKEKAKGYDSDDAKIEFLEGQITTLFQAVQNELSVFAAKNGSAVSIAAAGGGNSAAVPPAKLQ